MISNVWKQMAFVRCQPTPNWNFCLKLNRTFLQAVQSYTTYFLLVVFELFLSPHVLQARSSKGCLEGVISLLSVYDISLTLHPSQLWISLAFPLLSVFALNRLLLDGAHNASFAWNFWFISIQTPIFTWFKVPPTSQMRYSLRVITHLLQNSEQSMAEQSFTVSFLSIPCIFFPRNLMHAWEKSTPNGGCHLFGRAYALGVLPPLANLVPLLFVLLHSVE